MSPNFQHHTPPIRITSGNDALRLLRRELERVGVRRVALVYGPSMKRHGDALDYVRDAVGPYLAGSFEQVEARSPVPVVEAARDLLRDLRADAVIAVGGGSAIVSARAATILLSEDQPARTLSTQRSPDGSWRTPRLSRPKLPHWIIPSTPTTAIAKAGSAVLDPDTGERLALFDPKTRAQGIFFDSQIAMTAPPALTLSAGLDAFTGAVEGLQANADDPIADGLLASALGALATCLPALRSSPDNPEVRLRLMIAAFQCGMGTDFTGGGPAQAVAHAAGPRSRVSNGFIESIVMTRAMKSRAVAFDPGLRSVANVLGDRLTATTEPTEIAIARVTEILGQLGIPLKLRDVGIDPRFLGDIVEEARDDWILRQLPRETLTQDLEVIVRDSW